MLSTFWLKIIGAGAAVLLLAALIIDRNHQRALAKSRGEQLAVICTAVADATDNPKLKCSDTVRQIGLLGQANADLKAGIARQNAAVDHLAAESARQQKEAAQASQEAAGRAKRAEATADRLRASAGAVRASDRVCEPSETLQEAWR